jgi:hypothetical protein
MNGRLFTAAIGLGIALAAPAAAQTEWTSSRPDGHAPIGVMGDHTHEQGEFMFSYRFMHMGMEGSKEGTADVRDEDIVDSQGFGFMVTPTRMPMQMHMLGVMYAPSDRVTLMGMFNYVSTSMDHLTRMGGTFTTESGGLGDVGLSALVGIVRSGSQRLHLNLGTTIPVGSIEETDVTPATGGNEVQLPYPMQIGTGTWAIDAGATWLGMAEQVSWGVQGRYVKQLGENDRGWSVGDRAMGTGWLGVRATDRLSFSARGKYQMWTDYSGADAAFTNLMMVPTVRTDLRGGKRLDLAPGVNYWINSGALAGLRFLAEYEIPVWQDLSGPQLESTGVLVLGAQLSVDPS